MKPVQRSYIAGSSGLYPSFDCNGFSTNEQIYFLCSCVDAGDLGDGSGRKGLVLPVALYGDSKLPESPGRIIRQRAAAATAKVGPSVFASSQKACLDAVYWLAPSEKLGRRRTPCCVFLLEWEGDLEHVWSEGLHQRSTCSLSSLGCPVCCRSSAAQSRKRQIILRVCHAKLSLMASIFEQQCSPAQYG